MIWFLWFLMRIAGLVDDLEALTQHWLDCDRGGW